MRRLKRENTVPHGQRYKVYDPVMTIEPGETIVVETINHMTPVVNGIEDLHAHGSDEYREREETGPIFVTGAEPGDMLAIRIEKIEVVGIPHALGSGPSADIYKQELLMFPYENGRITLPGGLSVPYAPMVGDIYTTPKEPKGNYFDHGGNMDFTEVKPGNTLYLPVIRKGGLLVMGDVHAAQGDGEIYGEAAETAADVTVTIDIDRRYRSPRPLVETADSLICLAGRGILFESLKLVVGDMTELLSRLYGVKKEEAYILCTMIGSLRTAGCVCYAGKTMEKWTLAALSVPKDIQRKKEK